MVENLDRFSENGAETCPYSTPGSKKEIASSKLGNVEAGNKCVRLFIENANLRVGDKVQVVFPEKPLQKVSEAEIIKFSECKDEYFGDLVPDSRKSKLKEYRLKLLVEGDINRGFGIGLVNADTKVKILDDSAIIDLNDDGTDEYFRECTSNEGIHLTVWTGRPLLGKRIWHSYYYLGYDTEPNCTEKDHEEMTTELKSKNINSKIGIVDGSIKNICFRTKKSNLTENTIVSIVTSLDESPQKVLGAVVAKELKEVCSRYSSGSTDQNPGENHYYSLTLTDKEIDEFQDVFGIGVVEPETTFRFQNGLATIDLNNDGNAEFFRSCTGFEGVLLAIWTGKPLKGKQIWRSFYYLDYDTEPNCRKKDG